MIKNMIVVVAVLALVVGVSWWKHRNKGNNEMAENPTTQTATLQPALPRLVELGAGKCQACKEMKPVIAEIQRDYGQTLEVRTIDVLEQPEQAQQFDFHLIPCQIFLSPQGKELFRHVGFLSKEDILTKWKELGYPLAQVDPTSRPTG